MINKDLFDGMVLFCAVVEQKGFSAAARRQGHTASHVSKEITQLEERLKVRLLNRTTRKVSLTETGNLYYETATKLIENATIMGDRIQAMGSKPYGELRVSCSTMFAKQFMQGWMPEFIDAFPEVMPHIEVSEIAVDIVADGFDMVVRAGVLPDSGHVARKLGETRIMHAAAPEYLEKHGTPKHPKELSNHRVIDYAYRKASQAWDFQTIEGIPFSVPITPVMRCNDPFMILDLTLAGKGICITPSIVCEDHIKSGRLVELLVDYERPAFGIFAVYPDRASLAPKTRVFIDFLAGKMAQGRK